MSGKKIVIYELNEVPFKIFDFFAERFPKSSLAKLKRLSRAYETVTEDSGHLSPWITWPSVHRGVSNDEHEISDFGMDLSGVNREFPPIWDILAKKSVKVGVFGSLHTHPLPENVSDYAFFVPDTFAAGPECFPAKYEAFQDFNLRMAGLNASQVNKGIALRGAAKFLAAAPGLGLSGRTIGKLTGQIVAEMMDKKKVVRRRTSQVQIAFDFYLKALRESRPDLSLFFSNHVASSLHRYWPALFPEDYLDLQYDEDWRADWCGEIPFTMKEAAHQIGLLMDFVERERGYELLIVTSMGQAAVQDKEKVSKKVIITGLNRLMSGIGLSPNDWQKRPAMVPQYNVFLAEDKRNVFLQGIDDLSINGKKIHVLDLGHGVFRMNFGLGNQSDLNVTFQGSQIDPFKFGIVNMDLQDAAGANAYHIPNGMLLAYNPQQIARNPEERSTISTLEIAPALLRNFGVDRPGYMTAGFDL